MSSPPRLLGQLRQELRVEHYSYRTEQTYSRWVHKFILFHGKRHPAEIGKPDIEAFLTHLATERDVAASTQNQAMSAILFLNRHGETRTGSRRQVAACKQSRQDARSAVWSVQMSDEYPVAGSELKPPKAGPQGGGAWLRRLTPSGPVCRRNPDGTGWFSRDAALRSASVRFALRAGLRPSEYVPNAVVSFADLE